MFLYLLSYRRGLLFKQFRLKICDILFHLEPNSDVQSYFLQTKSNILSCSSVNMSAAILKPP